MAGRYVYQPWDTDATIIEDPSSYTGFMAYVRTNNLSAVCPWYEDPLAAAFGLGFGASLDFSATNGRAAIAYKSGTGITPAVTDSTAATNAQANGYNFYGAWATANQGFDFAYPGQVSGAELYLDNLLDDVWLNSLFQADLAVLMTSQATKSVPYNAQGYSLVKAALQDAINQALNFGAIRAGVTLSSAQAAEVNTQAGKAIDQVLSSTGYYLQVKDPGATARQNRQTPIINFWYTNGESVGSITLNSYNVL
jgi:hypothetical protein